MICGRQGLRKYKDKDTDKDKDKDKYKNNQQTYKVICFWKGDDKRSLIMQNMQNMQIISFSVFHFLRNNLFLFLTFPPFPFPFFFSSTKKTFSKYFPPVPYPLLFSSAKNSFLLFLLLHENIFSFYKYFTLFLSPSFLRDIEYNRPIYTVFPHINHQLANPISLVLYFLGFFWFYSAFGNVFFLFV